MVSSFRRPALDLAETLMSPLRWSWRDWLRLASGGTIGAIAGYAFGYAVFEVAIGDDGEVSFWSWIESPLLYSSFWWTVMRAIVGAGGVYASRAIWV